MNASLWKDTSPYSMAEWQQRALYAEKQAKNAMSCLQLLAQSAAIPEPWASVIRCAYLGCGGVLPEVSGNAVGAPGYG